MQERPQAIAETTDRAVQPPLPQKRPLNMRATMPFRLHSTKHHNNYCEIIVKLLEACCPAGIWLTKKNWKTGQWTQEKDGGGGIIEGGECC